MDKQFKLTKNDKKAAQLFMKLGMPKSLAKTLMYLSHVDECYSADIEQGANLRQPQVSLAMKELVRRNWVDEKIHKGKAKGRPRYIYKIKMDLSDIMKDIEQKKLREIESIKRELSELKHLIEHK